ncbi:hypothetical protein MPTK1_5g11870 [Marchantia polymorpha subsp. ruderalis]|uniref:Uncharacterized protein n=2 Tax=Marchantia polymorpha TaxID=3197 RepID=A0AAF6BHF3_MARPO|nr:hypothetical protein MARPO_0143s0015 [Marchantia polymorpha]BBN11437.1 hypothetical protein Mp_5g11870 [Marchantia polymorpha subsp. ruderalis]|eukprot:PTQ29335.1 hypothetical protein MARPO_0143s0015 [Marchantia polymorpha]
MGSEPERERQTGVWQKTGSNTYEIIRANKIQYGLGTMGSRQREVQLCISWTEVRRRIRIRSSLYKRRPIPLGLGLVDSFDRDNGRSNFPYSKFVSFAKSRFVVTRAGRRARSPTTRARRPTHAMIMCGLMIVKSRECPDLLLRSHAVHIRIVTVRSHHEKERET